MQQSISQNNFVQQHLVLFKATSGPVVATKSKSQNLFFSIFVKMINVLKKEMAEYILLCLSHFYMCSVVFLFRPKDRNIVFAC